MVHFPLRQNNSTLQQKKHLVIHVLQMQTGFKTMTRRLRNCLLSIALRSRHGSTIQRHAQSKGHLQRELRRMEKLLEKLQKLLRSKLLLIMATLKASSSLSKIAQTGYLSAMGRPLFVTAQPTLSGKQRCPGAN